MKNSNASLGHLPLHEKGLGSETQTESAYIFNKLSEIQERIGNMCEMQMHLIGTEEEEGIWHTARDYQRHSMMKILYAYMSDAYDTTALLVKKTSEGSYKTID